MHLIILDCILCFQVRPNKINEREIMLGFLQVKLRYNSWRLKDFEEEAPPPSEGSMHINARGHRPLTSPFNRGRGTGLCETGFNDPIVDLVHVPSYSRYSWLCTKLCSQKHECCHVFYFLSGSSCLFLLFNTPHICFNLCAHHILSLVSARPYLCFPSLLSCFIFLKTVAAKENYFPHNRWMHYWNFRGKWQEAK